MPAWAIGKCLPAADDAEAAFTVSMPLTGDGSGTELTPVVSVGADELAALREFKASGEKAFFEASEQHRQQIENLQAAVAAGEQALLTAKETAAAEAQALRAEVADLSAKLEAATKPAAETKSKAKG